MSGSGLYAIYFDLASHGERLRVLLSNACREEAVFVYLLYWTQLRGNLRCSLL